MNFYNKLLFIVLIVITVLTQAGCNFISDTPKEEQHIYKSDELKGQGCSLDSEELADFFEADVEDNLKCLEENFLQFEKYVERENDTGIGRSELITFVKKYFDIDKNKIVNAVNLVFKLNSLLLKDHSDLLSSKNIRPLIYLLINFNKDTVQLTNLLEQIEEDNFDQSKNELHYIIKKLSNTILSIITQNPGGQTKLNFRDLLNELSDQFMDGAISSDTIESILTIKKLFLGGDRQILTSREIAIFLKKLPSLTMVIYDLIGLKMSSHPKELSTLLNELIKLSHEHNDSVIIFSAKNLLSLSKAAQDLMGEFDESDLSQILQKIDLKTIRSMLPIKKLFLGGVSENITYFEIKELSKKSNQLINFFKNTSNAIKLEDDAETFKELVSPLEDLKSLLYKDYSNPAYDLLSKDNLVKLAESLSRLFEDDFNLKQLLKYIDLILAIKLELIGGHAYIFTHHDLLVITYYGQLALEGLIFNEARKLHMSSLNDSSSLEVINSTKEKFSNALSAFRGNALNIIRFRTVAPKKFNLLKLIEKVNASLASELAWDMELIRSILPAKILLMGGVRNLVTEQEVTWAFNHLTIPGNLYFDFSTVSKKTFDGSESQLFNYFLDKLPEVKAFFQSLQMDHDSVTDESVIFKTRELLAGLDRLHHHTSDNQDNSEEFGFKSMLPSIQKIKPRILDGNGDNLTFGEIKKLIDFVGEVLELRYFTDISYDYDKFREILETPDPVETLSWDWYENSEFRPFSKERLEELKADFLKTATGHRIFRHRVGDKVFQTYDNTIKRSKLGFVESTLFRWGFKHVLRAYDGSVCKYAGNNECVEQPKDNVLNTDEIDVFLNEAHWILKKFEFNSANPKSFAANTVLLTDLFQQISDGNRGIGVEEATIFLNLVVTSVEISDLFIERLDKRFAQGIGGCERFWDEFIGVYKYKSACYQKYYYQILLDDLGLSNHLATLNRFNQNESLEISLDYLINMERFAREYYTDSQGNNYDTSGYVTTRDLTRLIGAMLNVESIIIRYDENHNNVVDPMRPRELSKAFKLFKNTVIKIGNLTGNKKKYARSVFLYMVHYMKMPETDNIADNLEFLAFHKNRALHRKITARRKNISTVLYYLIQLQQEQAEHQ